MSLKIKNILNPEKFCINAIPLKHIMCELLKQLKHDSVIYNTSSYEEMECFSYRFIQMLSTYKDIGNINNALQLLKQYWGITSTNDIKELFETYSAKMSKHGYLSSIIKKPSKKSAHSSNCIYTFKPIKHRASVKDASRAIVCRGMKGNYGYRIYQINGPVVSAGNKECMLNAVKMQFHYDTGCPYYEVRPCLWTTWINLPESKQIGTK